MKEDSTEFDNVESQFIKRLEDDHWKVRYNAHFILKDRNRVPIGFKLPLWDRIRAEFSGGFTS